MPDRDKELKSFFRLLRQRQVSGDAGRIQIADRLAKMTLAELLRVPPWVIVRLGPKGLALLAERSAVIRLKGGGLPQITETADAAAVVPKLQPKLSWFASLNRRRPLWWECVRKTAVAMIVSLVLIGVFPFVERSIRMLGASGSNQDPCSQLDRWTGDCVYRVGSSGLSLRQAADRLALPVAALAAANPSLDPIRPLLPGTQIVVPRRVGINLR